MGVAPNTKRVGHLLRPVACPHLHPALSRQQQVGRINNDVVLGFVIEATTGNTLERELPESTGGAL